MLPGQDWKSIESAVNNNKKAQFIQSNLFVHQLY